MKKTIIKVFALALVAIMGCTMLASCGIRFGEYGNDSTTFEFSLNKVTITQKGAMFGGTFICEGTFEMGEDEDGNATITFDLEETDEAGIYYEMFDGEHLFNEGEDNDGKYIEIDRVKYYKK